MAVSFTLLLHLFSGFTTAELFASPPSSQLEAVIESLPKDPGTYTAVAQEAITCLLASPESADHETFQRLGQILAVLLYHDGRSFDACLYIADMASTSSAVEEQAVNALAAIANYLRLGGAIPLPHDRLLAKFESYVTSPVLEFNARVCLGLLKRRDDSRAPEAR